MIARGQEQAGVDLFAQPPGKKVTRMELLSGGEKALISLAFLLALMDTKPSPFALMDEIDAPLDDAARAQPDLGATFASPKVFAELIFPYFAELVEFFHSYGVPVVLHSCGFTEPLLDLIVEAGFDGLNPMEAKAGCDVLKFAEKYGDRLVLHFAPDRGQSDAVNLGMALAAPRARGSVASWAAS